ncbi:hypothetical protein MFLAVUS_006879 [Mucor flavus]|uniref:Sel1 repeat family protein n=1 Tax=Mucor flavus TaxID=439312 RepID=A0ABP9Z2R5_9FUNG
MIYTSICFRPNSGKKTADDWYNKGEEQYNSKNYNAALRSYLKSAASNHAKAQNAIGLFYYRGYEVDVDYGVALSWYLKAAEQGYSLAQYSIGIFYNLGYGVDVDYSVALSWYLKAAEQGQLDAQTNIGLIYFNGNGVDIDYNVAFSWLLKAAEKGHSTARNRFVVLYGRTNGVKLEYNEARELFTKAAEERNVRTELELSELKREARESKEQVAILLAKLAIKDSEIENFKRHANAALPQVIPDLAQDKKDEKVQKRNCGNEPIKFFQL